MPKESLSEDALLRMLVAAITETIARLAMLRTAGKYEQALEVIDQNLEELLGLKANLVRQLDDTKIVEMLTNNDFLDVASLYQVAEVFRQEGLIRAEMGQTAQVSNCQVRALNLYLEVCFAVENDFLEADDRVDELFDALGDNTPEDTLFSTFDYYEQVGAYDRAEISINRMLQATGENPDILTEKRAFYERMLAESDEELEAGGLDREAIKRAYQQL